jgi:hypothetical protein
MSDWVYIQADPAEQLMQVYHFSIIKQQCGGGVPFNIIIKEFAVPPPGQRLRFYAEADKDVNQKSASFVPCGWGTSIFSALGDSLKLTKVDRVIDIFPSVDQAAKGFSVLDASTHHQA